MPFLLSKRAADSTRPTTRAYNILHARVPLIKGLAAVESGQSITGRTFSQIKLTFSLPDDRADWDTARVWVKNYRGNPNFVQVGEGKVSPIFLLLEPSSETLVIAVQSELLDGRKSDIERSPTVSVVNDGV